VAAQPRGPECDGKNEQGVVRFGVPIESPGSDPASGDAFDDVIDKIKKRVADGADITDIDGFLPQWKKLLVRCPDGCAPDNSQMFLWPHGRMFNPEGGGESCGSNDSNLETEYAIEVSASTSVLSLGLSLGVAGEIKRVLFSALRKLKNEVTKLAKRVCGEDCVADIIMRTPEGAPWANIRRFDVNGNGPTPFGGTISQGFLGASVSVTLSVMVEISCSEKKTGHIPATKTAFGYVYLSPCVGAGDGYADGRNVGEWEEVPPPTEHPPIPPGWYPGCGRAYINGHGEVHY
jgi:hypothetical protein